MIRRPPKSPLFPSTPLFRSSCSPRRGVGPAGPSRRSRSLGPRDHSRGLGENHLEETQKFAHLRACDEERRQQAQREIVRAIDERSEEHTSELQSLAYLVCRL